MKFEQIQFTRFLAAISIVLFHFGSDIFPFNITSINNIFKNASFSVSYFYILSGVIMSIAYKNKGELAFKDYILKRFARIYPVYLLAFTLYLFWRIATGSSLEGVFILTSLTCSQSWIPKYALTYNYPAWSISVELFFYLLFPFLLNKVYKNHSIKSLLTPILIIFFTTQILFNTLLNTPFYNGFPSVNHNFLFYFPIFHLNEFLIGNLAGLFLLKQQNLRNYDLPIIFIFILICFALNFNIGLNYHNGLLAVFFVPLIILICLNNGVLTKVFKNKFLVFLGEISFGVYILQFPIFNWVAFINSKLPLTSNSTILFYVSLCFLIIVSSVSYLFFEVPLRNYINSRFVKHKQ
jgi:peptidoglycan/LPS O-acetylase OafA/YrhL